MQEQLDRRRKEIAHDAEAVKQQELRAMCDKTPKGPWWVGKAGIRSANYGDIVGDTGDWCGNAGIEPTAVDFLECGLVSLIWTLDLLEVKDTRIAELEKERDELR